MDGLKKRKEDSEMMFRVVCWDILPSSGMMM
jgi:hypothetical protein